MTILHLPHSANLRRFRRSAPNHVYFITKRCHPINTVSLSSEPAAGIFIDSLTLLRDNGRLRLLGFVLMPDHMHLIVAFTPGDSLASLMKSLFGFSSRSINKAMKRTGPVWQTEYYEHMATGRGELEDYLRYIYLNPVRAGLTSRPDEWRYSSIRDEYRSMLDWEWYVGIQK